MHARPVSRDLDEQTELGEVYLAPDARPAAAVGSRSLALTVVGLAALPVTLTLVPGHPHHHRASGLPFPWLVLGVAVYPAAWFLARWYIRQAERNEQDFAEVVDALVNDPLSVVAVALVCLTTLVVGALGLRLSRTHERLLRRLPHRLARGSTRRRSAASTSPPRRFLGVAGLVLRPRRRHALVPGRLDRWATSCCSSSSPPRCAARAPTRCPTSPRRGSARARSGCVSSLLVVGIGWLYLLPQFQGAGLTLTLVTGAPPWVGGFVVVVVIAVAVGAGGMRSITFVQAFQYWLKLTALAVPGLRAARALVPVGLAGAAGRPVVEHPAVAHRPRRPPALPHDSTVLAPLLGTMGLPHVLVRFYTNPDGSAPAARPSRCSRCSASSTCCPPIYGALGRVAYPTLPAGGRLRHHRAAAARDPARRAWAAQLLTAMLAGGAFAAFLSTASGLAMSVAGVIDQDLLRPRVARVAGGDVPGVRGFRVAAILAVVIPYAVSRATEPLGLATTVGLAFAVAASTFAPLLMLGIWWRRLSTWGAMAGLVVGGTSAPLAIGWTIATGPAGRLDRARCSPTRRCGRRRWRSPPRCVVSLATPSRIPAGTTRTMVRLHTPERVALARSRLRD